MILGSFRVGGEVELFSGGIHDTLFLLPGALLVLILQTINKSWHKSRSLKSMHLNVECSTMLSIHSYWRESNCYIGLLAIHFVGRSSARTADIT